MRPSSPTATSVGSSISALNMMTRMFSAIMNQRRNAGLRWKTVAKNADTVTADAVRTKWKKRDTMKGFMPTNNLYMDKQYKDWE